MLRTLSVLLILSFLFSCKTPTEETVRELNSPFLSIESTEVDSMLMTLTLEEKIGQLIFLKSKIATIEKETELIEWTQQGKFGGLLLENISLDDFITLHDTIQQLSNIPIFNGTQKSITLNSQFSDVIQLPSSNSIASIQNDTIKKELEDLFIEQCKTLNINFSFSPNIGNEFTSESPLDEEVKRNHHELAFDRLNRLKNEKILAIGNSFSDYYEIENDTTNKLQQLLYPHQQLIKKGISGYLIDESVFQIDSIEKMPNYFLKEYLHQNIGFDGLMIGEVTDENTPDKLLYSGVDIFIVNENVNVLFDFLKMLVEDGIMSQEVLNEKVKKILLAKKYAGLQNELPRIDKEKADSIFKNESLDYYARQLYEQSLILANNHNDLLPYTHTYRRDFRIVHFKNEQFETFKTYFSKYAGYSSHDIKLEEDESISGFDPLYYKHSTSIFILNDIDLNQELHDEFIANINQLSKDAKVAIINFGNAYNLQYFDPTMTQIQVFEKNDYTESMIAQLLFGALKAKGQLPMSITPNLVYGKSIDTPITRLKFTIPQEVGIAPEKLVGIDVIMKSAIKRKATPGGQIMVIKSGKVIYDKTFGHHTYKEKQKVRRSDLYDIASVSKVVATTVASMKLYEEKKFKLNDKIKKHLTLDKKSSIRNISMKRLFTHSSGLQANMPISKYYLNKDTLDGDGCNDYYCPKRSKRNNLKIASKMYFASHYIDTLWATVEKLKLRRRGRFKYSDVNFDLIQRVVEKKAKKPMDKYLNENFYAPLNLRRTTFNPLKKFKLTHIVPTEKDEVWRNELVHGTVHDESAALLGGVAGNSGLFTNANDLAVLSQMLLNGGTYGGKKYLDSKTIEFFTSPKHGNHRGLGFVVKGRRGASAMSKKASSKTYGHTGFTGTCVWVDPESDLIYIFLANRIHPNKNNRKLFKKQVRRRIHDVIYNALPNDE